MASEQDFLAYADRAYLLASDQLIVAQANGAGVNVSAGYIVARQSAGGAFVAAGPIVGGFGAISAYTGVNDWNDPSNAISGSGARLLSQTAANSPPITGYFHPFSFEYSSWDGSGNLSQFAIPYQSNLPCFFRIRFSGVWGAWQQILSENGYGQFLPSADNAKTLGVAAKRFSTIYAATGAINTSDEREKEWAGGISEREYAAGLEIIGELGWYQWIESVQQKGAEARLHFGARAQRVFAILDKHLGEGSWRAYALACYDAWPAEYSDGDGGKPGKMPVEISPAGDRYGLRIDQLLTLLIACMARRQEAIELRLDRLESAQ